MNKFENIMSAIMEMGLSTEAYVFQMESTLEHLVGQRTTEICRVYNRKMENSPERSWASLRNARSEAISDMKRQCGERRLLTLWVSFRKYRDNKGRVHVVVRQKGIKKPLPFKGELDIIEEDAHVYIGAVVQEIQRQGWELVERKTLTSAMANLLKDFG